MSKWSQEATVLLIEEVKKKPFLYEVKNPKYHHRLARKEAMDEIAKEVRALREDTSGEEVKARWNALRSGFQANLSKIRAMPSGSAYSGGQVWYFELLTFLKDSLTSRKGFCNLQSVNGSEVSSNDSQPMESSIAEEEVLVVIIEDQSKDLQEMESPNRVKPKKRKAEDVFLEDAGRAIKSLGEKIEEKKKKSSDRAFGDYVVAELEEMEDYGEKMNMKIQMMELIKRYKNK